MTFTISKPLAFFTVDKYYRTQEGNNLYRAKIERSLNNLNIPFEKGIGYFNGNVEVSYKITHENLHKISNIVFNITDQDSVLVVDTDKTAKLIFQNKKSETIGTLQTTSQHVAQKQEGYSIFDNKFYIVK